MPIIYNFLDLVYVIVPESFYNFLFSTLTLQDFFIIFGFITFFLPRIWSVYLQKFLQVENAEYTFSILLIFYIFRVNDF